MKYVIRDKIIDFEGKEHQFIIAAIKETFKTPLILAQREENEAIFTGISDIKAIVKMGIAICNPMDTFNNKIGFLKAMERASNGDIAICSVHSQQITDDLINTYLLQEAEYIKNNPDKFIKGYKDAKNRYVKRQEMKQLEENWTLIEKAIIDTKKSKSFLDNIQNIIEFLSKCKK